MNRQDDAAGSSHADQALLQTAAGFLDDETNALDRQTRMALADARARAAASRRRQWLAWGGGGMGLALAASLTAVVIMPRIGSDAIDSPGKPAALAQLKTLQDAAVNDGAMGDIALTDDTESALADDLAFVAWLEENHDPS